MKIAVLGAGAIGGLLAARLAHVRNAVAVIDRGAHLQAIQSNGISIIQPDGQLLSYVLKSGRKLRIGRSARPHFSSAQSQPFGRLFGNVSFNPTRALTHATLEELFTEPTSRALTAAM